jgi:predicted  nucleic acid-binding Zn-ribbon protein
MRSEEAANALKGDLQKQSAELASLRAELETWPPRYEEIGKQASALLDLVRQLQEKVKQLSESFESTVLSWRLALTGMTRERDFWRAGAVVLGAVAVGLGVYAIAK